MLIITNIEYAWNVRAGLEQNLISRIRKLREGPGWGWQYRNNPEQYEKKTLDYEKKISDLEEYLESVKSAKSGEDILKGLPEGFDYPILCCDRCGTAVKVAKVEEDTDWCGCEVFIYTCVDCLKKELNEIHRQVAALEAHA